MKLTTFRPLRAASQDMLHLDTLRFIASCGIVLHHSKEFFFSRLDRAASEQQSAGLLLFVDLFFAISGFVIAYLYAERIGSVADFGRFMQRRIGRLVPLHWLTLILSISVWVIFLKLGAVAEHVPSFRPQCLAETALLVHAAYPCGGISFNGVSWSISAEMAMYVAFPLFAFAGRRSRLAPFVLAAAMAAVLLAVAPSARGWENLHPFLRALPSFLFGVGLWFCRLAVARLPAPRLVLAVSLPLVFVVMLTTPSSVLTLPLVYLVVISAVAADLQRRVAPLVQKIAPLGQLTYSMYMWHPISILIIMNVIGDKLLKGGPVVMAGLAFLTYGLILLGSYISFEMIETPARKWIDNQPPFGQRRAPRGEAPTN